MGRVIGRGSEGGPEGRGRTSDFTTNHLNDSTTLLITIKEIATARLSTVARDFGDMYDTLLLRTFSSATCSLEQAQHMICYDSDGLLACSV